MKNTYKVLKHYLSGRNIHITAILPELSQYLFHCLGERTENFTGKKGGVIYFQKNIILNPSSRGLNL